MKLSNLKSGRMIDGVPEEFQVFPYGRVELEGGDDGYLDEESMKILIAGFKKRGNDMVIDYEHQSMKEIQAPAAGWVKQLVSKGKDGLWAVVEWTDNARKYLAKKEYRYFSPVFWIRDGDRKIIKILNVALTNNPRLNNLRPIIASLNFEQQVDSSTLEIAKLFGNTKEDLILYGGRICQPSTGNVEGSVMNIAKLMGNTKEDIEKYGNYKF